MSLKTVIFDLDDTLYTDWRTCHEAGLAAVDAYGVSVLGLPDGEMRRAFLAGREHAIAHLRDTGSAHNRVLFAQFGLEGIGIPPIPHAEPLHSAYWSGIFDHMTLEPAIPALLAELRAAGIQIAVCTNMMTDIQLRKLNLLGIADQIDCIVTSEEAGVDKPQPGIFAYLLHKCGCLPQEAIMLGDNVTHDACGAQAVGIPGVWINRTAEPLPAGEAPRYEVCSMEEAAALVRTLCNAQA